MLRVQIKDEQLKHSATLELLEKKYKLTVNNKNGDCFFIWTDGSKKAELSHWTNDNHILIVDDNNYRWFINCLCDG